MLCYYLGQSKIVTCRCHNPRSRSWTGALSYVMLSGCVMVQLSPLLTTYDR